MPARENLGESLKPAIWSHSVEQPQMAATARSDSQSRARAEGRQRVCGDRRSAGGWRFSRVWTVRRVERLGGVRQAREVRRGRRRGACLTERDLEIVRWLDGLGGASLDQIRRRFGLGRTQGYRRV
jgi:hypothetical protein